MITIPVELGRRRYEVVVGPGARHELRALVAALPGRRPGRVALVTQAEVAAAGWVEGLDPGAPMEVLMLPEGEGNKTLGTVEELCRGFARAGLARDDLVVAVGGGLVSDVAGFAAASWHRGTRYVTVATSLLGQVDAAVGGKTAVNLPEGKNLVGAFWQPSAVVCDTETLATLPPREWACGRGEMAKYAFLGPGEPDLSLLDLPIEGQVARCVALKAAVVAEDEREGDRRMLLNYGHTLAHALEAADLAGARGEGGSRRWDLRHGEAVAVGLVFAALLAQRLGRIDESRVALHRDVVGRFDLRADLPAGADPAALVAFMARDKKAHHDLTFVLDGPEGLEAVHGVDADAVLDALQAMGAQ